MAPPLAIGHVGTYPPTRCGIATFTRSLARSMARAHPGGPVGVVALVDDPEEVEHPPEVACRLVAGSPTALRRAARMLNGLDLAVLQHEYGIYGGTDGDEALELVAALDVPVIAVLHTVPDDPTAGQRAVLEQLCAEAAVVVVLSRAARRRLVAGYDVDPASVRHIPHGATPNLADPSPRPATSGGTVLTWGLIGPGKGIEWGIEAMALLRDLDPAPRYVVVGETHPKIVRDQGQAHRLALVQRASALGVEELVSFEDVYVDLPTLLGFARQADVVLLPYDSRDQVVSGVLVEAVASGKPVVATRFPHAVELLSRGSGLLVPHEDPDAIAAALRSILTRPDLAASLRSVARVQAGTLAWNRVGEAFAALAVDLVRARRRVRGLPGARTERAGASNYAAARSAATTSSPLTVNAPTHLSAAP